MPTGALSARRRPRRWALGLCSLALLPDRSLGAGSLCPLPWNRDDNSPETNFVNVSRTCPEELGRTFPIKKFSVTIPKDPTLVQWICVVYGVVPFAVIASNAVLSIFRWIARGGILTRDTSFFLFLGISVLSNEMVLKRIIKESRPERSCSSTCGFPSGHSTMALGFFTLLFLDGLSRVRPKVPLNSEHARRHIAMEMEGWPVDSDLCTCWKIVLEVLFGPLTGKMAPLAMDDVMDLTDFAAYIGAWGLYLIPVPFSRVVLQDHTEKQVMVGSVIGIVEAICWFYMVRKMQARYNHVLGQKVWKVFLHNYGLPSFEVYSRTLVTLERWEATTPSWVTKRENAGSAGDMRLLEQGEKPNRLQELDVMYRELGWYHRNTLGQQDIFVADRSFHELEVQTFNELQRRVHMLRERMLNDMVCPHGNVRPEEGQEDLLPSMVLGPTMRPTISALELQRMKNGRTMAQQRSFTPSLQPVVAEPVSSQCTSPFVTARFEDPERQAGQPSERSTVPVPSRSLGRMERSKGRPALAGSKQGDDSFSC